MNNKEYIILKGYTPNILGEKEEFYPLVMFRDKIETINPFKSFGKVGTNIIVGDTSYLVLDTFEEVFLKLFPDANPEELFLTYTPHNPEDLLDDEETEEDDNPFE